MREAIEPLEKQIKSLKSTVKGSYESLRNAVQAVAMLKYDKDGIYKAELTSKQSRLIDAIANYGAYWARKDGYDKLAEDMEDRIGISKGVQEQIDALEPRRSRDEIEH